MKRMRRKEKGQEMTQGSVFTPSFYKPSQVPGILMVRIHTYIHTIHTTQKTFSFRHGVFFNHPTILPSNHPTILPSYHPTKFSVTNNQLISGMVIHQPTLISTIRLNPAPLFIQTSVLQCEYTGLIIETGAGAEKRGFGG